MSMITMLATFMLGFAGMLGIMGKQQWERNYRIAASFSLVAGAFLLVIGAWMLLYNFDLV